MKKSPLLFFWLLLFAALLSACSLRPYDYLDPARDTLAAQFWGTPTTAATLQMVPTFTPLPPASVTPSPGVSPLATLPPPPATVTPLDAPPPGASQVLLENRTGFTVYVRLLGREERVLELAPAEAQPVELPSGVYRYWLVISGRVSLHGQKAFAPGFSLWTFYDTPGVLQSPTPWRPGWGSIMP